MSRNSPVWHKELRDALTAVDRQCGPITAHFGPGGQITKAMEELAELLVVLAKRKNESPVTDEQIIDEIADSLIMAYQMAALFGSIAVAERIEFKIQRTMKFIAFQREQRKNGQVP